MPTSYPFNTIKTISGKSLSVTTLILSLFLLQACSQLQQLVSNDVEKAETLLAQEAFYPALDVIDRADQDHPNYRQLTELREKVLDAIKAFEKASLEQTQQQINQGQWTESLQTLDQALEKIPASKPLLEKRQRVQRYIDKKLAELAVTLAQSRASTMAKELDVLKTMSRYSGDTTSLETRAAAASTDRKLLLQTVNNSIDKQQWHKAKRAALLVQTLEDDRQIRTLLAKIEQHIVNDKVSELREAIDNDELLMAQQLSAALSSEQRTPEVQSLIDALNQKIDLLVLDLTRSGQQAYTNGNIDSAITHWQQALELRPEDTELQKRLERAKAFQENYRRLKGL